MLEAKRRWQEMGPYVADWSKRTRTEIQPLDLGM